MGQHIPIRQAAASGPDRRADPRHVTVLKVGRAIVHDHDALCLVRNMSDSGMQIQLREEVKPEEAISVELRSDRMVSGTVKWTRDSKSGIEFDRPVNTEEMLDQSPAPVGLTQYRPRAPRFGRVYDIKVGCTQGLLHAKLANISLNGGCIMTPHPFEMNQQISVYIPGLSPRQGTVRWISDGRMGVLFAEPWPFAELAAWLKQRQD